jgi:hypothetical protein
MPRRFSFVLLPWLMKSRRIVARPDFKFRDLVLLILLACPALPGFASTTAPDPALASHQGAAYTLQDGLGRRTLH